MAAEPLVFDPYPCARCGERLQWIVSFGDDRSRLAVIEFASSRPHRCRRPDPPKRAAHVLHDERPRDPVAEALLRVAQAQRESSAVLAQHLAEVRQIADRAGEALAAADSVLRSLRGRQLPPDPDERPDPPRRTRGGMQI